MPDMSNIFAFFDEIGVRVRKFFLLGEVLRRVSAAAIK